MQINLNIMNKQVNKKEKAKRKLSHHFKVFLIFSLLSRRKSFYRKEYLKVFLSRKHYIFFEIKSGYNLNKNIKGRKNNSLYF